MWATVIGFVLRYLPELFKWFGGQWTAKKENDNEERMLRLQFEIEGKRAELAGKQAILQAEIVESLAGVQAEIDGLRAAMEDRKSAREYGAKLVSLMDQTLARGKELGVWGPVLSLGWAGVLLIEMLSASVQPMIAVCAFAMWMYWKLAGGQGWTDTDWWLMETVVGFYLAGRVQKVAQKLGKLEHAGP